MVSLMEQKAIEGAKALGAKVEYAGKEAFAAGEHAVASVVDAVESLGTEAIDTVTGDARELALEAMQKLGAVHVALDKLDAFAAGEIQTARENVASAIVSVARHLAG